MSEIPKNTRWKIAAILAATATVAFFLYHLPQKNTHREGSKLMFNGALKGKDASSRKSNIANYVAHGLMHKNIINSAWGGNAKHSSTFLWNEAPIVKFLEVGKGGYRSKFKQEFESIFSHLKLRKVDGKINYLVLIENGSHAKILEDGKSSILNQLPFSDQKNVLLLMG